MQLRSTEEPGWRPELEEPANTAEPPVTPEELAGLARWIPPKEMALLIEVCKRAELDPDLTRPALLLCSSYGKEVARMLDQDPFPMATQRMARQLQQLRQRRGL